MKTYFLPVGLFISLCISLVFPEPGVYLKDIGLIPWCMIIIFFVNGYQTHLKEFPRDSAFLYTLFATGVICLIISPIIGLLTASALQLSVGLTLGLLVTSVVPSTLSTCIVMTNLAGGRGTWALMMTVVINIVGVFSIPFMLGISASENIDFYVDPVDLLQTLILLVLCPLILGFFIKNLFNISPQQPFFNYLPSAMVICAVWISLSDSAHMLYDLSILCFIKIALASVLVHFGLMLIAILAAHYLPIDNAAKVAMVLTASQKTLPVAVSILAILEQNVGEAILFCVLFHFIQLFADAALLPKLKTYYKL